MSFFDDILKTVPAEDQAILNKYPQLKSSVEKMETDLSSAVQYAGNWLNWKEQNWDPTPRQGFPNGRPRAEAELAAQLDAANAHLSAAAAGGADDQELAYLRKELQTKVDDAQKNYLQAIEGMNIFYESVSGKLLPHQKEFGENLNPKALREYMVSNKIIDPDLAYDRMVAGRRSEMATQTAKELEAKHAEDIKIAEQRGRDQAAKEQAMGPNGSLPTDQSGGIAGITAHVATPAKISDAVKAEISEAKLGSGELPALGYQLYQQGAFPQQ